MRRLTIITGILLLLTQFNTGAMVGISLCVGKNGHIEIEFTRNGKCFEAETDTPLPGNTPSISSLDSHCGDCHDIPLLIELAHNEVTLPTLREVQKAALDQPGVLSVSLQTAHHNTLLTASTQTVAFSPSQTSCLRSTILLI